MLQQQLQQRDEDLAARNAEIGELKERLAELENLRQQQQQLLAFKDSELAAAQQRLAAAREGEASPTPAQAAVDARQSAAVAQQSATQAQPPVAEASASSAMPWVWGSLALLGLALLAWVLRRRASTSEVTKRPRAFDSEALAASMAQPSRATTDLAATSPDPEPVETTDQATASKAEDSAGERSATLDEAPTLAETPAWHPARRVEGSAGAAPVVAAAATPSFVQTEESAAPAQQANASQRLKLAVAFQDIGDDHSARQLLIELLDDPDPAARIEAARLLRDLG